MQYELSLQDYIAIIKRRVWYFIIPFVALGVITIGVALLLPAIYQSTGKILVESQQIPTDLIRSTVTGQAAERIQIIRQRVMTRANLSRVIDKFDVFPKDGPRLSVSEQIDEMRDRIGLELVSGGVRNRAQQSTIAFDLSYEDRNPKQALRVTNELITLFLDENVRTRTARASETTDFLENEADKLRRSLEALETQIASFKAENANALPEQLAMHLSMLQTNENELKRINADKKATEENLRFLQIELTGTKSGIGSSGPKSSAQSPAQQLAAARSRLVALQARYLDDWPDIIAVKEEIAGLEKSLANPAPLDDLQTQLAAAKARSSALLTSYSEDNAEVKAAEAEVSRIEAQIAQLSNEESGEFDSKSQFDLTTARLNGQIAAANARIEVFDKLRGEVKTNIADLQARILQTPEVERGLAALTRDYDNSLAKYEEIKSKQLEAQLAQNLEEGRKAERFSLLEPPVLPETPTKPNRNKIIVVGLFAALAVAAGVVAITETLFGGITSPGAIAQILRQPPLGVVPQILTKAEELKRKRQIYFAAAAAPTVTIVGLIAIHFLYMPLDIIAYKAMARF